MYILKKKKKHDGFKVYFGSVVVNCRFILITIRVYKKLLNILH